MLKKEWIKNEETQFLILLHLQPQFPNFKKISQSLKKLKIYKTSQQCYNKWYNNKKKINYKIKFSEPKKKFSLHQEKLLLKLSFSYDPFWKKISDQFIDKNRFDVSNHFYGIVRKGLRKACKLIGIKKISKILWGIKPKLYSSLINKEIKVDLRDFKKSGIWKKDGECPDFCFVKFYEFIKGFYFNEFEEIWEKIREREIFIVKKVIVYVIEINLNYNRKVFMMRKKQEEFYKNEHYFLDYKKKIEKSFFVSFYQQNLSILELLNDKDVQNLRESDKKKENNFFNFENHLKTLLSENEINIVQKISFNKIFPFCKSKNVKSIDDILNKNKEENSFLKNPIKEKILHFENIIDNCTIKKKELILFRKMFPKIKKRKKNSHSFEKYENMFIFSKTIKE